MQFTLNKNEITNILHTYVNSLFRDSNNVSIELSTKPKSGVCATITVPSLTEVPVETPVLEVTTAPEEVKEKKKKSPPPLETFIVQEDEPEEENKENVVTSGSLFSKIG